MRWRYLLVQALLLVLAVGEAAAEPTSLLMLRDIRQVARMSYRFTGTQAESYSNYNNQARQTYRLSSDYAVVDPKILNGRFSTSFSLNQVQYSGDGNSARDGDDTGFSLFYDVRGAIYNRKPVNLHFFFKSETEDVASTYDAGYTVDTRGWGASLNLKNRYLPGSLSYSHSSSESDGTSARDTSNDIFTALFSNTVGISNTQLRYYDRKLHTDAFFMDDEEPDEEDLEFYLRNRLAWESAGKSRSLVTSLKTEEYAGRRDYETSEWGQALAWQLGKALDADLSYRFITYESDLRDIDTNEVQFRLRHRLFESLTTQFYVDTSEQQHNPGYDKRTTGHLSFSYNKQLPRESRLSVNAYQEYGVVDRSIPVGFQQFVQEQYTVEEDTPILLSQPDVLPASISICKADLSTCYSEGSHYLVEELGDETEITIIDNAAIQNGDELRIAYAYLIETESPIEYANTATGVSFDLGLYRSRYRIYGGYNQNQPTLISGDKSSASLSNQRDYRLGFESHDLNLTWSVEYERRESGSSGTNTFSAGAKYYRVWNGSRMSFYARDQHRIYDDYGEDRNTLTLGADYLTSFKWNGKLKLRANYRTELVGNDAQSFVAGADWSWRFRKLVLSIRSEIGLRDTGRSVTTQEQLRFDVTRFF